MNEFIQVCAHCGMDEVIRVKAGLDDTLDYCRICSIFEPDLIELKKHDDYDASYDDSIAGYSLTSGDPIYR